MSALGRPLRIALVAGEPSGDQLGFKLMRALRAATGGEVEFLGVGGDAMGAEGLDEPVPALRRHRGDGHSAGAGALADADRRASIAPRRRSSPRRPDALVIIDSPDFTHRVARRVRRALPALPVIDYVSPSVWAWRPGRARAMRAYVDCVLALLPFEPAAHERLGGPRCIYVGHPLVERIGVFRPNEAEARRRAADPPLVLVLPGSRRSRSWRTD